ncbi:MAG: hypothetical protein RR440_00305 [Erysipelotrichaceae bacterium]
MGKMETKYNFFLEKLEHISDIKAVYTVDASDKAIYPYIVIDIPNKNPFDGVSDEVFLDIDIWHKSSSGKDVFYAIEGIADEVESKLNKLFCDDSEHTYLINQIGRIRIPDTERYIQRRKLKYQIKAYNRY